METDENHWEQGQDCKEHVQILSSLIPSARSQFLRHGTGWSGVSIITDHLKGSCTPIEIKQLMLQIAQKLFFTNTVFQLDPSS